MIQYLFFMVLWFIKPHAHVCQGLNTLPDTRGHSANVRRDSTDFRRKPGALLPSSPSPAEAGSPQHCFCRRGCLHVSTPAHVHSPDPQVK